LKEAESGVAVSDLLRRHGIAAGTYYRWKSQYSGMEVSQLRQLKELQTENARLRRIVADQILDVDALKEINSKNWSSP